MKDYYIEYENYHKTIVEACDCINAYRCSKLGQEVFDIQTTIDGLSIDESNWGDSVADSFLEVKNQFVSNLSKIIDSIDSSFVQSEGIYEALLEDLNLLKETNESYKNYKTKEPNKSDYYETVMVTDAEGGQTYSRKLNYAKYESDHKIWQDYFDGLKTDCERLVEDIEAKKVELQNINGTSVSVNDVSAGISGSLETFSTALLENEKIRYEKIFETDGSRKGTAAVIWKFLKYKGLSDAAIAGVLGNIQAECSFDPTLYEASSKVPYRRKGYGLIQWTNYKGQEGGRRDRLFKAAEEEGADPASLQFQLEYLWKESLDPNSSYGKDLKKAGFYDTNDPGDAAYYFHKYVEISADSKSGIQKNRVIPAENWYEEFHNSDAVSI